VLFNSVQFILFFAIFYSVWLVGKNHIGFRWLFITLASFFFYGWWSVQFLGLLVLTGIIDFTLALLIFNSSQIRMKRLFICGSLLFNLGALFSFKYAHFFLNTTVTVLSFFGYKNAIHVELPRVLAVLPIGISFYTFESLSYVFDVYKGHLTPTKNILHYFSFLAMFPRLIAGPIERPANLLPQLTKKIELSDDMTFAGLKLVALGYFKKTVIADNLAIIVNTAFTNGRDFSSAYWWYVMICFAIQIYCDFSGYTDIARGLAQMMGFRFNVNFNHPYSATSLREFWTRWHISLSTWFRDYVYIPLGGDRKGQVRAHINLWITMIVSGLWHGASWTFAVWGALHAFYMSLERLTKWPQKLSSLRGGKFLSTGLVFFLVVISWVYFRAESFKQASFVLKKLFSFQSGTWGLSYTNLLLLAFAYEWYGRYGEKLLAEMNPRFRLALDFGALAILSVSAIALRGPSEQFIYFQF